MQGAVRSYCNLEELWGAVPAANAAQALPARRLTPAAWPASARIP